MDIDKIHELYLESEGVSTDSRSIKEGQVFFALKGDRFDGHKYVDEVLSRGASYAVIDNAAYSNLDNTILVDDVLTTLQALANFHRQQFNIPVLGITGSNGKTTTKELCYQVLSKKYNVLSTQGNFNNHIGVPLTLLNANKDHDFFIIEMGANKIGDIKELCVIANPNYGLITNIGRAHIEGFGSVEGIIEGKTELYRHLKSNGGIIFCDQDDRVLKSNLPSNTPVVSYEVADLEFLYNEPTLAFIDLESGEKYSTHLFGMYNQNNIETAVSVGRFFKVLDEDIFEAVESYQPNMNRSEILKYNGLTIIKDAYNANPSSMKLSIKSMMNYAGQSKILILGDMKELGDEKVIMHQEILDYLSEYKWKDIFLVGPIFKEAALNRQFKCYDTVDALKSNIEDFSSFEKGSIILLKGSRSMQLEQLLV